MGDHQGLQAAHRVIDLHLEDMPSVDVEISLAPNAEPLIVLDLFNAFGHRMLRCLTPGQATKLATALLVAAEEACVQGSGRR